MPISNSAIPVYTLYPSNWLCVGCVRSPQSLT